MPKPKNSQCVKLLGKMHRQYEFEFISILRSEILKLSVCRVDRQDSSEAGLTDEEIQLLNGWESDVYRAP